MVHLQAQDISPHTVNAYRNDVAAFFAWLGRQNGVEVPPVEVTTFDIQKYCDAFIAQGHRPAGVNRCLASLRAFFAWVVQTKRIAANPAGEVEGAVPEQAHAQGARCAGSVPLQRIAAVWQQLA